VKGLSSSSHGCGIDDSISPTEGSNIPVFGSLTAALAGCCWDVIIIVVGMMIDELMMEERN